MRMRFFCIACQNDRFIPSGGWCAGVCTESRKGLQPMMIGPRPRGLGRSSDTGDFSFAAHECRTGADVEERDNRAFVSITPYLGKLSGADRSLCTTIGRCTLARVATQGAHDGPSRGIRAPHQLHYSLPGAREKMTGVRRRQRGKEPYANPRHFDDFILCFGRPGMQIHVQCWHAWDDRHA
jgi:hypothetical protein